jgi:hypothetical protein
MMEWVVYKYVRNFVSDYKTLQSDNLKKPWSVNPLNWTPMNIKAKHGHLLPLARHHLGFVFRTTGKNINRIIKHFYLGNWPTLPAKMTIFVKYLSSLLNVNYDSCLVCVSAILSHEATKRRSSRAHEWANQERMKNPELSCASSEYASSVDDDSPHFVIDTSEDYVLGIKHPFLCMIDLHGQNPMLVM